MYVFGNTAVWGGGLLVKFEDSSKGNKMIINNTNFSENRVILLYAGNSYGTSGGGVRIEFVIYEEKMLNLTHCFLKIVCLLGTELCQEVGLECIYRMNQTLLMLLTH